MIDVPIEKVYTNICLTTFQVSIIIHFWITTKKTEIDFVKNLCCVVIRLSDIQMIVDFQ